MPVGSRAAMSKTCWTMKSRATPVRSSPNSRLPRKGTTNCSIVEYVIATSAPAAKASGTSDERGREILAGLEAKDRREARDHAERLTESHQESAQDKHGKATATDDTKTADRQHERADPQRAPQVVSEKQPERNVRDHPREAERTRDDPELPVGERGAARDVGEDRRKGAAGDEIGEGRETEQSGQGRHEAFYGKPLPHDRGHDPA